MLENFGLQLRRFGGRGNAMIGRDRIVYIKLDTGQWWIDRKSPGCLETVNRDIGIESLRAYLVKNVSRLHAFFRR